MWINRGKLSRTEEKYFFKFVQDEKDFSLVEHLLHLLSYINTTKQIENSDLGFHI